MAIIYTQEDGFADDDTNAAIPTRRTRPTPDDITVDGLASNEGYLNNVRAYMSDRLGDKGKQQDDEENEDYVERFLTHMRSFENRSIELTGQIDYMRKANADQRKKFLNAYTLYNQLPGFMSEGGGGVGSAIADYAYYNIADPVNIAGLGVGSIAAKQLAKQGVKGLMLGMARYGAVPFLTDGTIGAGMDLGLQKVEKETGIRDEYDFGRTGIAFGASGAGSAAAQGIGLGLSKGVNSVFGRDLADEGTEALLDANADRAIARNDGNRTPEQVAIDSLDPDPVRTARVKASPNTPDAPFDAPRGRAILDRMAGESGDMISPELRLDINRYVYDFLNEMLEDLPNKELALQLRTPSGERVADEQISDTVFRVLQNEDLVGRLDEDALSGALARNGVSAEEFAQIYRVTVGDAARQMNAASQFAKKLARAGVLDRTRTDALTAYLTDKKPVGIIQRGVQAFANPTGTAMTLDRNRRGLLVSQIPTLIRNVGTTGIRGTMDAAADIIDAAGFYAIRKAQKALGQDVPDYSLGSALSDAFGMVRNLNDQGFSKDVVAATLGSNPKLLQQISRSLTDIGDGELAAPVRLLNYFNMTHDGLVRRAIYTSALEKQLRRQTGLSIAETIAKKGKVPLEFQQKAVREALEFTFADMPTGPWQSRFVQLVERMPFIGTSVFTFPRFTVSALNFTANYVLGGKAGKGVYKLARGAATGNDKFLNEGMTDVSKGIIGTYMLFESVAHRAANQDVKWFEYRDEEGKIGDLRPFFPLAPYLLVADILVKYPRLLGVDVPDVPVEKSLLRSARRGLGNLTNNAIGDSDFREDVGEMGTGKSLPTRDIVEGLLGTRLAGTQLYIIDGLFKAAQTEGELGGTASKDSIGNQKLAELAGNFFGELFGGPLNVNFVTGLVRDIVRTFDSEEAIVRDMRGQRGNTTGGRFADSFVTAATRGIPYMNQDRPPLESATRPGNLTYQSPLVTTFTGIRKTEARTGLEDEIVRLGITYNEINPSTGDAEANRLLTKELGIVAPDLVNISSGSYQNMTDAEKKNYIIDTYATARSIAREIAIGKSSMDTETVTDETGKERQFSVFDRQQWGATPQRIRTVVNQYYIENFGATVEQLGAYRAGNAYAKAERGKFK